MPLHSGKSKEKFRLEIVALLEGGNAHMTFDEVISDFPIKLINGRPPHTPYTCWHFLEHMRITQWDILEFIQNPDHISPDFPAGYRPDPVQEADSAAWNSSVKHFKADLNALKVIALDADIDLFSPIPHAKEYTYFRELLLAADHNSYCIGEFALLRQILNAWPADRPYLTGNADF
jgi:hypothetical protein